MIHLPIHIHHQSNLELFRELISNIFPRLRKVLMGKLHNIRSPTLRWFIFIMSSSKAIELGILNCCTLTAYLELKFFLFAFNHPNYARWIVRYSDNLLKLKETHLTVYEKFKKGWFSLQKSTKSFSAQPIDLTMEKTINADNQRTE